MDAGDDVDFQELEDKNGQGMVYEAKTEIQMNWPRRQLLLDGRLGSSPPKCTSKCGNCTPCKLAVVSVPPGPPRMMDYYPVIWKCNCGDKYYDP
ncbi:hypothetical protein TanjilG_18811 [Lupinus angustifolius]|uniref:Epidermal patterning factor-like protein n=2 Tax=Lupinus angustifolius TaxID=3871 RepID=A0A4P1RR20_LUPAN|nr:hypothetical protein TanjilG_18811 [Lupinus angustifolius]